MSSRRLRCYKCKKLYYRKYQEALCPHADKPEAMMEHIWIRREAKIRGWKNYQNWLVKTELEMNALGFERDEFFKRGDEEWFKKRVADSDRRTGQ